MPLLDIRSLVVALAVASVASAIVMVLVWSVSPRERSLRLWAGGRLLATLGGLLIAGRGAVPDVLSFTLGPTFILCGGIVILWGAEVFIGRRPRYWLLPATGSAMFVVTTYLTFVAPDGSLRVAIGSAAVGCVNLAIAVRLSVATPVETRSTCRFTAAFEYALACVMLGHAAAILQQGPITDILAPGPYRSAALLFWIVGVIATTLGFVAMTVQRALAELDRARRAAEEANRAKSRFIASMNHELRTPLHAVLGFARLLADDEQEPLSQRQRQYIDYISGGGKQLLSLIDEVLDLSRIEAGHVDLRIEPVEVDAVVAECLDLVHPMAAQRKLAVSSACAPGLRALADHKRLRQALLNLLSNAVKYNREQGSIAVECALAAGGLVRVAVKDTGQGIAPERFDAMFQPFSRLGAEQTETEGTGIGLNLSKTLVELMGGRIGFTSEPGRGSTFWIELPRAT
ncbi:MAG: hypothetical protein JNK11_10545 [Alphaproteobacteria bacterium]|nr:hypothetical protein [Alphaproteobacteria bacterium]